MTRDAYMAKLQKYLRKLPKQDYEDAIEYFNEYFSDADEAGQKALMEELGTPKEAASDLMYHLLDRKLLIFRIILKKVTETCLFPGR